MSATEFPHPKPKVVAVIPARGGSKRLPRKNVRPLAGRPLIAFSIEDGKQARWVDRVIVSTDDPEVREIALREGAEVPFLRPAELSGDKISDVPVLAHAAQWLEDHEDYRSEILVLLRPTTPLRVEGLIDRCVEKLVRTRASSVRSVRSVGHWHPYWMLRVDDTDRAVEFEPGKTVDVYYQSQLLPPLFKHDGYCDTVWRTNVPRDCSPTATLAGLYGVDRRVERNDFGHFINIDTLEEFELAEYILRRGL